MILKDGMINNVIIDTGVLLRFYELFIDIVLERKKLKENIEELTIINQFLSNRRIYIVPQNLAEIYSLLKRNAKSQPNKLQFWLKNLISYFKELIEEYIPKNDILEDDNFLKYGFTDIALSKLINESRFLLTNDYKLVGFCKKRGLQAHHYEELFLF